MLDAEILKAAPQFEVPSGLPDGPWRVIDRRVQMYVQTIHGWVDIVRVNVTDGLHKGDPLLWHHLSTEQQRQLARAIAAIPAMVEQIGRLRRELEAANKFMATDAEDYESLRALNAELIKAVQDMLYWADTPSQDIGPSWITGACHRARVILAKSESKSATTQPQIPGLPAQAPTAASSQPAPRGIIETEKSNDAG